MPTPLPLQLHSYWSQNFLEANFIITLNLLGSFLLGLLVGFERSFRGRAAGMRTYALVCMASTALTCIAAYPHLWFGGLGISGPTDPTRVIQGIVTGIGFLGSGVIIKDGLNISGLTTSASIWASACIGILVGAGFYAAAILMALAAVSNATIVSALEHALPQKALVSLSISFSSPNPPPLDTLADTLSPLGYTPLSSTTSIKSSETNSSLTLLLEAKNRRKAAPLHILAHTLRSQIPLLSDCAISYARN